MVKIQTSGMALEPVIENILPDFNKTWHLLVYGQSFSRADDPNELFKTYICEMLNAPDTLSEKHVLILEPAPVNDEWQYDFFANMIPVFRGYDECMNILDTICTHNNKDVEVFMFVDNIFLLYKEYGSRLIRAIGRINNSSRANIHVIASSSYSHDLEDEAPELAELFDSKIELEEEAKCK